MSMFRILVIDDDPDIRAYLNTVLVECGFSVTLAENGEKGLVLINENSFDLVITDIFMPEVDGFEVISALSAGFPYGNKEGRPLHIIAMTGGQQLMESESIVRMARMFGVDDTMVKPFNKNDVQRQVLLALYDQGENIFNRRKKNSLAHRQEMAWAGLVG